MATTARSTNHSAEDLGVDSQGSQVTGYRQSGVSMDTYSLWFAAGLSFINSAGVDDVGIYLTNGGTQPTFVIVGWIEDKVVKSESFKQINNDSMTDFVNQVHHALNQNKR
ncbi:MULTISPECIES: hypothetical protein [Deinococcus]|uniref:Uncharacterized protein n=1 Tax=Deinococcus rufus TaxID=2136097 RepID=A0ABV7ZCJ0_9DEIO|nr:hypothetical protein [Deinococcus sp. AB2017081]WQE94038.1 hypothetical protein U2P90_11525 [Deinococcus sp. AB2017081]